MTYNKHNDATSKDLFENNSVVYQVICSCSHQMLTWESNSRVHMSVDGGSICELQEEIVKEIQYMTIYRLSPNYRFTNSSY